MVCYQHNCSTVLKSTGMEHLCGTLMWSLVWYTNLCGSRWNTCMAHCWCGTLTCVLGVVGTPTCVLVHWHGNTWWLIHSARRSELELFISPTPQSASAHYIYRHNHPDHTKQILLLPKEGWATFVITSFFIYFNSVITMRCFHLVSPDSWFLIISMTLISM